MGGPWRFCALAAAMSIGCGHASHVASAPAEGPAPSDRSQGDAVAPRVLEPGTVRAIGGGPPDPERHLAGAIAKIDAAFCDREVHCGNVGPSEKYGSRADCASRMAAEKRS